MHWLFLIDRKWLFLFGSTWLIQPDANTAFFMRDTMAARMYTEDMREICELQEIELLIIWIVINGIYFWIMNRKVGKELKVDDK